MLQKKIVQEKFDRLRCQAEALIHTHGFIPGSPAVDDLLCLINELQTIQVVLEQENKTLMRSQLELARANTAVTSLLGKMNRVRNEVEKTVHASIKQLILPYVEKLKNGLLGREQKILVEILESNLHEIAAPFVADITAMDKSFTPMEIQIAHLVREGRTNKEIARILTIAPRTVGFHRENIREKLGIKNKKINLRSVLLSLGGPWEK